MLFLVKSIPVWKVALVLFLLLWRLFSTTPSARNPVFALSTVFLCFHGRAFQMSLVSGGWTQWSFDVPSNPYSSVILWFYEKIRTSCSIRQFQNVYISTQVLRLLNINTEFSLTGQAVRKSPNIRCKVFGHVPLLVWKSCVTISPYIKLGNLLFFIT